MSRQARLLNTLSLAFVGASIATWAIHFAAAGATTWLRLVWLGLLAAGLIALIASRVLTRRGP
ncbi:MAG TPA: hypothetical protein VIG47_09870 [Gemmatimonadaceae bacterium]|jgi:hypothetical protein